MSCPISWTRSDKGKEQEARSRILVSSFVDRSERRITRRRRSRWRSVKEVVIGV